MSEQVDTLKEMNDKLEKLEEALGKVDEILEQLDKAVETVHDQHLKIVNSKLPILAKRSGIDVLRRLEKRLHDTIDEDVPAIIAGMQKVIKKILKAISEVKEERSCPSGKCQE